MSDPTLLTIVRHGETSANLDGVWHGSTDTALTERGARQAEAVGRFINAEFRDAAAVYASDLQRARHTGEAIARHLGHEIRIEPRLREYDLGSWEERPYSELLETERFWERIGADPDFAPIGAESPRTVVNRMTSALRDIASEHAGRRVVVVSHGGALSMTFGLLIDGQQASWERLIHNCSVSELLMTDPPELKSFNLTGHLEGV